MKAGMQRRGGSSVLRRAGFFAFRAAALPMRVLTEWAEGVEAPAAAGHELEAALTRDRVRLGERLARIGETPEVLGALAVASPDLLDGLRERPGDPAVVAALARYLTRMASRPTPFGLFAGCGVGEVGERTRIVLAEPARWRRSTRLDADYLDALIRERSKALRERLTLRPNGSLHLMGGCRRYVESRLDGLERSHHLVEVADSPHLRRALAAARAGATLAEVAAAVAAAEVDLDRAARFAGELVDAQVLVPDLDVMITGPLPLDALIADLRALGDDRTAAALGAVRDDLASIDAEGVGAAPARHERIAAKLGELGTPVERARLLQVDVTIPHDEATLAAATVEDILRGAELLRQIAPPRIGGELDRFRASFGERYEGREVSLLEALDEELGVGFGSAAESGDPSPLLKGLALPATAAPEVPMGRREQRLVELLQRAPTDGAFEIDLSHDDVAALGQQDPPPLPDAGAARAVLAQTGGGLRIVLMGASGPSGAALLGRFCHADPELARHVRAHLRAEEALDPDAIYAEIVHLPSGRMVNILARPVLRGHEIEWLGRSGAPPERRIPASDLLLSLRAGRFVLRSRTLGRRVIPRLTSAHNYNRRSPGVYRFLAAVQTEGTDAIGWSWSPFDKAPFRPRVRHGRLILARAGWHVAKPELRELDRRAPADRWRAVQAWRERRRLPRWVCLADYDNVLPVDLDNALSADMFVRIVRRREEVLLEELYPGPDELVGDAPDGKRALEIVVPFVSQAPARPAPGELGDVAAPLPDAIAPGAVRRTFAPGSPWTYLKLYTGSATADRLLRDQVAPLARDLVASEGAASWFFLRYADPGYHLRVRFKGDPDLIHQPLQRFAAAALEDGLAHDALFGTYQRELERYGGTDGILVAERLFHADSDAVVELLGMFDPGETGLDERWRIGLLGAEALMADLGLDQQTRAGLSRRMRDAFEREFKADAALNKAIAAKVRAEQGDLEELLEATADSDHPLAPGVRVLAERSERVAPLGAELAELHAADRLALPIDELAVSYVHMWLNRLCRSKNRFHEYVIYALLARLHEARAARVRTRR